MSLEGVAILNIPSMHGGSNLWGETKKVDTKGLTAQEEPEVIVNPEILKVTSQGILQLTCIIQMSDLTAVVLREHNEINEIIISRKYKVYLNSSSPQASSPDLKSRL